MRCFSPENAYHSGVMGAEEEDLLRRERGRIRFANAEIESAYARWHVRSSLPFNRVGAWLALGNWAFAIAVVLAVGLRDAKVFAGVGLAVIVAYEMLTGRSPFATPPVLLAMAGQPVPVPPSIDHAAGELVLACLRTAPRERPTIEQIIAKLEGAAGAR